MTTPEELFEAQRQMKHPPSVAWWATCTAAFYVLAITMFNVCHTYLGSYDTGK